MGVMSTIPDNIVIGTPLTSLESLDVDENESVAEFTFEELRNDQGNVFLPHLLKQIGVFGSTSECKKINEQRQQSSKFNKDPNQNLWRNIDQPELTRFKIGHKVFWLIVGE